jgi:hypothetical protein
MTNQEHPITPPLEMVEQWADMLSSRSDHAVFSLAAQWGADQEPEACCEWLKLEGHEHEHAELCAARRPKPPSLKEEALEALKHLALGPDPTAFHADMDTIRRALEALPND